MTLVLEDLVVLQCLHSETKGQRFWAPLTRRGLYILFLVATYISVDVLVYFRGEMASTGSEGHGKPTAEIQTRWRQVGRQPAFAGYHKATVPICTSTVSVLIGSGHCGLCGSFWGWLFMILCCCATLWCFCMRLYVFVAVSCTSPKGNLATLWTWRIQMLNSDVARRVVELVALRSQASVGFTPNAWAFWALCNSNRRGLRQCFALKNAKSSVITSDHRERELRNRKVAEVFNLWVVGASVQGSKR